MLMVEKSVNSNRCYFISRNLIVGLLKYRFGWFRMGGEMKDIVKSEKTYWHPAFFGATKWELKENKDDL